MPEREIEKTETPTIYFSLPDKEEIERDYEQAKRLQELGLQNEKIKLEVLLNSL